MSRERVRRRRTNLPIPQRDVGDEYETFPEDIKLLAAPFVEEHDVIWEPFPSRESPDSNPFSLLPNKVVRTEGDFYATVPPPGCTVVVTNPPFGDREGVIKRLCRLNLPFALLVPSITIQRKYFVDAVKDHWRRWSVLMPSNSVCFHKRGVRQHIPAFKCVFIYCGRDLTLAPPAFKSNDRLADVNVRMFDYEM